MNEISQVTPDEYLDASGLKCPLPVLKAKKALKSMPPGATLRVVATDPGAMGDFAHFCDATGDDLLAAEDSGGVLTFLIRKASPA